MTDLEAVLTAEDPVPDLATLIESVPASGWTPQHEELDRLLYFYGRIFGGGLGHAIAAADDGVIPHALALIDRYGSTKLRTWSDHLQRYFPHRVLCASREARVDWEINYLERSEDPEFEQLAHDIVVLQYDLSRAVSGYALEHRAVFERS